MRDFLIGLTEVWAVLFHVPVQKLSLAEHLACMNACMHELMAVCS